jgi:two-component system, cell cycle response regulator
MELLTAIEERTTTQPMRQSKIMIVDDDPALRDALNLRLRANHYQTVSACDGYSALALANKERPDLILLDLGLPGWGDGFAVLKILQEFPLLAPIPVIILTARDPQVHERRSLESGAVAFLQKPADDEELLGVIRRSLPIG